MKAFIRRVNYKSVFKQKAGITWGSSHQISGWNGNFNHKCIAIAKYLAISQYLVTYSWFACLFYVSENQKNLTDAQKKQLGEALTKGYRTVEKGLLPMDVCENLAVNIYSVYISSSKCNSIIMLFNYFSISVWFCRCYFISSKDRSDFHNL